jgi:hypothetical protein
MILVHQSMEWQTYTDKRKGGIGSGLAGFSENKTERENT